MQPLAKILELWDISLLSRLSKVEALLERHLGIVIKRGAGALMAGRLQMGPKIGPKRLGAYIDAQANRSEPWVREDGEPSGSLEGLCTGILSNKGEVIRAQRKAFGELTTASGVAFAAEAIYRSVAILAPIAMGAKAVSTGVVSSNEENKGSAGALKSLARLTQWWEALGRSHQRVKAALEEGEGKDADGEEADALLLGSALMRLLSTLALFEGSAETHKLWRGGARKAALAAGLGFATDLAGCLDAGASIEGDPESLAGPAERAFCEDLKLRVARQRAQEEEEAKRAAQAEDSEDEDEYDEN